MFSLWVCPDCRRIGSLAEHAPGTAIGLDGATPVKVSIWKCNECGQIGELAEVTQGDATPARRRARHELPEDFSEVWLMRSIFTASLGLFIYALSTANFWRWL
jgi:ribosomal protein L37AE/L43A